MKRWPSLTRVLSWWSLVTAAAWGAVVWVLHLSPPDEFVEEFDAAGSLADHAVIGALVVGLPSVTFLFLLLFIGAIAKRWLVSP